MFTVPAKADNLHPSDQPAQPADAQATEPTDMTADSNSPRSSLQKIADARKASVAANEEELAGYLLENPGFFLRHAEVLADARVPDPNAGRAISLQERQLDVLRQRNKAVQEELKMLMRTAQDNEVIADRLSQWTRQLLLVRDAVDMPTRIVDGLQRIFSVPSVAMRIWNVDSSCQEQLAARGDVPAHFDEVDASTRRMTNDLSTPYCGLRGDIAQARWLDDGGVHIRSVALLSLRSGVNPEAFGLVVMGSPDSDRFQTGMGTEFLETIAQTASAALARLTVNNGLRDSGDTPGG
jgi:uncharacterized protein YigA (DUF484 family)